METLYHISPVPCTGESLLDPGKLERALWREGPGAAAGAGAETDLATGTVQAKHGQEGAEQE